MSIAAAPVPAPVLQTSVMPTPAPAKQVKATADTNAQQRSGESPHTDEAIATLLGPKDEVARDCICKGQGTQGRR